MVIAETVALLDYSKPPPGYTVGATGWNAASGAWGLVGTADAQPEALDWAWEHYKAHNDPPGFSRGGAALICWPGNGVLVMFARPRIQASRTAAWTWYDRRHALAEKLHDGTFCPECYSQDAYSEVIDAETSTQPWCTECDVEMGGLFDDDLWPRLLAASDEQVAEVERWLRDSTAEMPEVLRG